MSNNNDDFKESLEIYSPYANDVMGIDIAEETRKAAKQIRLEKEDHARQAELQYLHQLETSRLCGPFYVVIEHLGLNQYRCSTIEKMPFNLPPIKTTGSTREQALFRMKRYYAFTLVGGQICNDLIEAAEVAANTDFIHTGVPLIMKA